MHWLLAVASAAAYGGADFLGGLASRRAAILPVIVASQVLALVLIVIAAPLVGGTPEPVLDSAWGGAAGIAYGVGLYLLYRGLADGPMSLVAPVAGVCGIAFPVGFGFAVGEQPSAWAMGGIALAVVAIVLVSREPGATPAPDAQPAQPRAVPRVLSTAVGAGIAFGLFFVLLSRTSPGSGLWPLVVTRFVAVAGFAVLAVSARTSLRLDRPVLALALAGGSLDIAANCLYLLAVRGGMVSLVATVTSLYPAATVLLAGVVLPERIGRTRAFGLLVAVGAVVAIGVSRGA